jgi:hypothetical protein
MNTMPLFDEQLAAALPRGLTAIADVLLPRVALGLSPEHTPPLPLLQAAARECEAAGIACASDGRPAMVVVAQIARAAALLLQDQLSTIEGAERSLAHALSLLQELQPSAPAWIQIDALVLLAELMARVAGAVPVSRRDGFIDRGLAVARSADYLCAAEGAHHPRARALALQAELRAGRFGSVRDRELMDSIDHGQHAIALLGESDMRSAVRWSMLLLTMGNAALGIARDRAVWVPQALHFYTLGRRFVDADRYPRLAAAFHNNLALWQGDGAEESLIEKLPPPEQRARAARSAVGVRAEPRAP